MVGGVTPARAQSWRMERSPCASRSSAAARMARRVASESASRERARAAAREATGGSIAPPPSPAPATPTRRDRKEHTSELQSQSNLVCRLLLEKKKKKT